MSGIQGSSRETGRIARSAIWITCVECGDVRRALAVMAGRVLQERRHCPACGTAVPPRLSLAPTGARIPSSEGAMAPIDTAESDRLYGWIRSERNSRSRDLVKLVFRALSDRFSRRRAPLRGVDPLPASLPDEMAIQFPASEKQSR